MKLAFKWGLVLVPLVLLFGMVAAYREVYRAATFKLYAVSADRQRDVRGLPFKGVNPHPLDGCLRIYVFAPTGNFSNGVWQTTIPWGRDLRIEWHDADRSMFSIFKGNQEMMTWKVQADGPECIVGKDLITYDPHELWRRTGHPTPAPATIKQGL